MRARTWGLAAAAAASCIPMAAHAQSSVTLYGIIDVGIEYVNNANANGQSLVRMQSGNLYGSRWGIKGEEDLGGGLTAFFLLENGFNVNDGTLGQSGRMFGRRAYVGLRKDGNEIQLGRMQTPIYETMAAFDPNEVGVYAADSHDLGLVSRADNAVKFKKTIGGFTGQVMYSFGYDGVGKPYGGTAGDASNAKNLGASLVYKGSGWRAALAYDKVHGPLTSTAYGIGMMSAALVPKISSSADRAERYLAALRWDLGRNSTFVGYRFLKTTVVGVTHDVNMAYLGDQYQFTPTFVADATVYHSRVSGMDVRPTTLVVDFDYLLSKRTDLYLNTSYAFNTRLSDLSVDAGSTTVAGKDQFGVQAGIRHRF